MIAATQRAAARSAEAAAEAAKKGAGGGGTGFTDVEAIRARVRSARPQGMIASDPLPPTLNDAQNGSQNYIKPPGLESGKDGADNESSPPTKTLDSGSLGSL